jgi:soluble lytic murein transglycosylase
MARWRLAALTALGLAPFCAVAVAGCGPATPKAASSSSEPGWLNASKAPVGQSAPEGSASVSAVPASLASPDGAVFDPGQIVAILDHPRLASVRAFIAREAYKGAANQFATLMRTQPPAKADRPAWEYQLGRLRDLAGDPKGAVAAYDRSAASDWPLAHHARFLAGERLIELAEPRKAIGRLEGVRKTGALAQERDLALAQAYSLRRDVDRAAPIWRAYLAHAPLPKGWQDVALRFARALLNQPSTDHAEEAVTVARQIIYASRGGRGVGEAQELERQALATIPTKRRKPLTSPELTELVTRARELGEARQGREAIAAADKVIAKLTKDGKHLVVSEAACEAYLARARGLAVRRRYSEASKAAGIAIDRCDKNPRQVVALFLGGRYALRGGQLAKARQRYAKLEQNFPKHSYADDARLHGAEAAAKLGDMVAFTNMLSRVDDAYPEGDMVDQALFSLARTRFASGDWAGAVVPLERSIARQRRGRPYYAEGRPQYFLARAKLALGQRREGLAMLAQVVREFPLSYYMVHAYRRLSSYDASFAARVLQEAKAKEPQGNFVITDNPELHRPAFLRAIELTRQGDGVRALAELEALGVRDESAHPSLLWASAFLLARIDAPAQSHHLLRSTKQPWTEHYPAGIWRAVWEVAFPRPYATVVERETKRSGISQHLAYAIMREESAFKPRVVSHAGAYGLMQLILPTAKMVGRRMNLPATIATLKQPAINIALGCSFLGTLQRRFDYNPLLAIPGYNAGPGAPARWVDQRPAEDFDLWVEKIPYKETRRYTKRVIKAMAAYATLYAQGLDSPLLQLPLEVQPGYGAGG